MKYFITTTITAAFFLLSSLLSNFYSQTIFNEDFEGALDGSTNLPTGWSEMGLSTDGFFSVGTDLEADAAGFWPVPAHTMFAMSNDDVCDCDKSADRLIMPAQDFSGVSGILTLNFSTVADDIYSETFSVEVSTDGGANWTSVYVIPRTSSTFNWQNLSTSLSTYVGMSNVLISFLYSDQANWGSGMAIDDVSLVVTPPPTSSGDLFISEYGEGSSNNKYLEIYNHTGGTVDLSTYSIKLYSNGAVTPTNTLILSGNLADNTAYVIGHGSATDPMILGAADMLTGGVTSYNGNDALELINGTTVVDMIGIVGVNPGTSWSVAGDASGALNHTLIRKSDVCNPNPDWTVSAGTDAASSEWIIKAMDDVTDIGIHTIYCDVSDCPPMPLTNLVVTDQTICEGNTATISVTPNYPGSEIYWYADVADVVSLASGVSFTSPTLTASESYFVEESIPNCGASTRMQVNITVEALPVITSALSNPSVCSGADGSITINGSGTGDLSWTGTATGSAVGVTLPQTISLLSAGNYSIQFTSANGCVSNTLNEVLSDPSAVVPTISASGPLNFCDGESIVLTSSEASGNLWSTGETTQAITVNQAGTYSTTVTASGCSAVSNVLTTGVFALPTVDAGLDLTVCENSTVLLTASGALTYAWDNGVTDGVSFNIIATTTYTVTGTDANGCQNTDQVTISVNSLPNVNAGNDVTVCEGESVILAASGAVTYSWDNGIMDGISFVPLNTATYTVTGTDANNCQNTDQVMVSVNPLPTVDAGSDLTVCDGSDITLSGNGAMTYSWDNGVVDGISFVPLNTATYTVTGTDGNGCQNTDMVQVIVNALPSVDAGTDQTICVGESVILNGTGSGVTASWDSPLVINGVSFEPSATATYSYTITDVNGCTNSDNVMVTVNPVPSVNAGSDLSVCGGDPVTLNGISSDPGTWNNGVVDGVSFTPFTTAEYIYSSSNIFGCSGSDTIMVTVNTAPTISSSLSNPTICSVPNGSITVMGTGSNGILMYAGPSSSTLPNVTLPFTINNIGAGNYVINYSDGNGCSSNQLSVNLSDPGAPVQPTITASGSTSICENQALTLTSSYANGNQWSSGESSQSITVTMGGSYSVTVTDNGCSSTSLPVTVSVLAKPIISFASMTSPSICAASDATITVTCPENSGTLTWTSASGSGSVAVSNLQTTISGLAAGSYNIEFTNANACTSDVLTVSISDPGAPVAPVISALSTSTFCQGGSVILQSDIANVMWSTGETAQSITVSSGGIYTAVASSGACTSASNSIEVIVHTLPVVSAGADMTVCQGESLTLSGSGALVYSWDNGVNDQVSFIPTISQTYTVTGMDANGCESTDDVFVTVNQIPAISVNPSFPSVCGAMDGSIEVTGTASGTLSWSGAVSGSDTGSLPMTISNLGAGSYTLNFVSDEGCATSSVGQVLMDPGAPSIPSVSSSLGLSFCEGESTILTTDASTGISWSTGETSSSITVSQSGNYFLTVTQNGCSASSFILAIDVLAAPSISLASSSDPSSCGAADGSAVLTGNGGMGTLSWTGTSGGSLSGISLPAVVQGLQAGSYEFVYNDACTSNIVTVSLSDPNAPTAPVISAGGATTICAGSDVTLSSNVGGVVWSTAEMTQSIVVNTTGTYSATLTNGGCTSFSNPIFVEVMASPVIDAGTNQTVCLGDMVTLMANGGTSYNWDNGVSNGVSFVPSSTTTYMVTGTDANGCSGTDQVTVTVKNLPPTPVVSLSTDPDICETEILVMTSSIANGITWSTGETSQSISVDAGGAYFVTKLGANGCSSVSDTVNVTVSVNILVQASASDTEICAGDTVILSANGAPSGLTWLPINVSGNSAEVIPGVTTTYTVQLVNGACTSQDDITITVNALPVVDAGADDEACLGDAVILSASGALTYSWDNGIQNNVEFIPEDLGALVVGSNILTVVGTDANGCSSSDEMILIVDSCEGIDENTAALIKVYPNPSNGIIHISAENLTDYKEIIIRDNLGRVVARFEVTADTIDLSALANGKYYLILTGEKEIVTPIELIK